MSEIKWIKITTDMFDNRKIKHLRNMPEGNNIVLIWVMLLTIAGKCNDNGLIYLTKDIPYTPKMLADELKFEENIIKLALDVLQRFSLISIENDYYLITGWQEHQNVEGMDKIREQNRIRKQKQREREKMLALEDSHVKSRDSHATEEDKNKIKNKIRIEEDKKNNTDVLSELPTKNKQINYKKIVDDYNRICKSYSKIKKLTKARKDAIRTRLNTYTLDEMLEVFRKAEASDFLKGKNNNWKASFDWLIKDNNMAKVLEGNYDNNTSSNYCRGESKTNKFNNFTQREYSVEEIQELERRLLTR